MNLPIVTPDAAYPCRRGTLLSFKPSTKKNVRNVAGFSAVGLAAVMLLAPAVSTANFSASDTGTVAVKTATLSISLGDDKGTVGSFDLNFTNLKPGEVQHQKLYVTNNGSIPATAKFSLPSKVSDPSNGSAVTGINAVKPDPAKLTMGISGITSLVPYKSLSVPTALGSIAPGETKTYVIDAGLDATAGNEYQGVTMSTVATVTLDQQ